MGEIVMRLAAIALVLFLGANIQASANSFLGFADASCGRWTEVRAQKQSIPMQSWVLGYISGVNTFGSNADFLKDIDSDAAWGWIDNYCRRQPLELFAAAVQKLAVELKTRTNK